MRGKGLKPGVSLPLNVQKTAEAVYDHTYLHSPVCGMEKSGHYVFSSFVRVKVKGGEDDLFLRLLYHIQPVKKSVGIVVNVGNPLGSGCLAVEIPFFEMVLKFLRYFLMSEIGNGKKGNIDQYQYKYDPARS